MPVIFAKKSKTKNIAGEVYLHRWLVYPQQCEHGHRVQKFLNPGDRCSSSTIFLANGAAMLGLIDIVRQARGHTGGLRHRRGEVPSSPAATACGRWASGWSPWPGGRAGRRLYPLCRRGQVNSFRKKGPRTAEQCRPGDFFVRAFPGECSNRRRRTTIKMASIADKAGRKALTVSANVQSAPPK